MRFSHLLLHSLSLCLLVLSPSRLSAAQPRFLENDNPLLRGVDAGFLLDTPERLKIDLSGVWNYELSGGEKGTVKVPSAFDFEGEVTFERTFDATAEQIDRFDFSLVMYGVNYDCEVRINGDFVANHIGGYTTFIHPIAPNTLQIGRENIIRIRVRNTLNARSTIPSLSLVWGWRNYGGILRDVFILGTPRTCLGGVEVSTRMSGNNGAAKILVRAKAERNLHLSTGTPENTLAFFIEVFDKISGMSAGKSPLVPLGPRSESPVQVQAEVTLENPKVWSPESPEIYLVRCFLVAGAGKEETVVDGYDLTCGIRSIERSEASILLNGKRVVLKGVIWNEYHPSWGSALTYEEMEKDVVLMKTLGGNAVRFANHPPHPYMLDLCDRYGLLALVEIPIVAVPSVVLADEGYLELASTMMKEMIVRDRHHPSVVAWGIGDEFETAQPASRSFVESLVKLARGLDSRPLYYGCRDLVHDNCSDLVDFAAANIYAGDTKSFKKQLEEWKEKYPEKPFIVGRFGTEVEQGNRSGYSHPLSYEAQARFFLQRFDILKTLGYDGAFVWAFNDWKGDRPALTVRTGNPWMHTMGLVSDQREKRLAYEAVRSFFRGEKFVSMPIGNYSAGAPMLFVLSGLVLLIGSAYFYNANRRFRESLNRSLLNAYNFFSDVRDQRLVSIVHSSLLGLIVSLATSIVLSSVFYHFRDSWVLDNLLSFVLPSDSVKEWLVYLVWSPTKFIPVVAALLFVFLLLLCGLVMALSLLVRAKIFPYHAYTITMWSTPPLILLVPVGMILFRVMESSLYVAPALIFIALVFLWVFFRLLKGVSIIFDVHAPRMYVLGVLSVVVALGLAYLYFDYTQSASTYWTFLYRLMSGGS